MLPELRPYQQRTNTYIRCAEATGPARICIQAPTGSGKSVNIADLLTDPKPQLLLTHRRIMLAQLSATLRHYGIRHGFRASGFPVDSSAPIQLAMIQTEWKRAFVNSTWPRHKCARVHLDEMHAHKANVAQRMLETYYAMGATILGWTATPVEVAHLVDELHVSTTTADLIRDGFLVPPVIYTPDGPDAEKLIALTPQNGEFSARQMESVWQTKAVFGSVVPNYIRLNQLRKPTILFAPGVPHSLYFAQNLTAAGIPSAHLDGKQIWFGGVLRDTKGNPIQSNDGFYDSDDVNRAALFRGLESGQIRIICNRFCLREGWDCPVVEFVILATAFGSRASFVQACGRGLRPNAATGKKRCVFLDHGANFWRFPPLDSPEPWDMGAPYRELAKAYIAKRREGKEPEPIVCPKCDALRMSGPVCPECQFRSTTRARKVMQVDGSLKLATGPMYKPKPVKAPPTDADIWKRHFWGARKHGRRTFNQVFAWCRRQYEREFPRNLKLMPRRRDDWAKAVADVPFDSLF